MKTPLIGIMISLLIGATMYLASNNLFITLGTFLIFMAYFLLVFNSTIKKYTKKTIRIHNSYHFINSFLITMSVKDSLDEAYLSAIQGNTGELKDVTDELKDMDTMEKLNYLRKYFNIAIYKMFLDVLALYLDQGGSILSMADSLMLESSRIEETLNKSNSSSKRILSEFIILWLLSIGVLLFMRFSISEFYLKMLKNLTFIILLCLFFFLLLISIHIFLMRITDIYIKEDNV